MTPKVNEDYTPKAERLEPEDDDFQDRNLQTSR